MYFQGKPHIPPHCTVERRGEEVDLTTADFGVHVDDVNYDESGRPTITEIYGIFHPSNQYEDTVETGLLEVPFGSDLSTRAHQLKERPDPTVDVYPRMDAMIEALCDRVTSCRGIVNGECWALGTSAVQEVLRQVTD